MINEKQAYNTVNKQDLSFLTIFYKISEFALKKKGFKIFKT